MQFINSEKKEKGFPVVLLFREGRAPVTLLLWVMFFMNLLALFFLNSWLPTVLHKAGLPQHAAIVIAALLHFGGIAGGLAIAPLCDKFNPYLVLACAYILSGTFIAGIGYGGESRRCGRWPPRFVRVSLPLEPRIRLMPSPPLVILRRCAPVGSAGRWASDEPDKLLGR